MNAQHRITIEPAATAISVHAGARQLARSDAALVLRENGYAPVYYVPRGDVDMTALSPAQHATHCPYKGDASYFDLAGAEAIANIAWSYETPLDSVAAITGHLAFYADKCDIRVAGQ